MTPREIAEQLGREAEHICAMLLPGGKRVGHEWEVGSVDGEEGKSLRIRLDGGKAGMWKDFAVDGHAGDLLDLYAKVSRVGIADAIKWAKDYLGIHDDRVQNKTTYRKPEKPKCTKPKDNALAWLLNERMLSRESIEKYKIASEGKNIIFPYLRDGQLIFVKYREAYSKKMWSEKNCEPILFGWQAIPESARSVVICEGELDAPSWWMMGYPALSVPNGAKGNTWIENEYDNLQRFDMIYLSFDMDKPGQDGVNDIVERLGRERCKLIKLPCKDANDFLKQGKNVKPHVENAKTLDPQELKPINYYTDKVIDIFSGKSINETGFYTPWPKVKNTLRFRPGEVTLLAGVNGHGKSEGAGHITLAAITQDERACVASMEFKPERWVARITRQASAMEQPSADYIRAIHDWLNDNLWAFDIVGTAKAKRILDVFIYARKRYGIKLFVIDNLAKCGFDEDDYNGQKDFVDQLTDFAKEYDSHVILILHMRKRENDDRPAGKMDIKGTGALSDMVDTVLIWWRNKPKEKKIKTAESVNTEVTEEQLKKPDALVYCEKQRNGEDEPQIALWFDKASHQFLQYQNSKPKRYVNYSSVETESA